MTPKDKTIQELRRENAGLREELALIVESCRLCRYCQHSNGNCSPTGRECSPEWRGYAEKT